LYSNDEEVKVGASQYLFQAGIQNNFDSMIQRIEERKMQFYQKLNKLPTQEMDKMSKPDVIMPFSY
jgi:hypothetical protein